MATKYRDTNGDLYLIDPETGEKTLIQSAESEPGEVSDPKTTDDQED